MEHEVFAVRYGALATTRSAAYLNWPIYGEPDAAFAMDYYFWVLRAAGRTTLLDCGFAPDVGRRRGREVLVDPIDALRALGVGAVDRIVVSHAHYDHIGNLARLPGEPEIVMARRELEFWLGPCARRAQFAHFTEPAELTVLAEARAGGRVTTFDGALVTDDGIALLEVGGHTPGQLVATVPIRGGEAVLAADALHFYDELTADRPFFVVADLPAMYAAFDTLDVLARPAHRVLVAGHDADVAHRFRGRAEGTGIDDLVVAIEAPPG